MRRARLKGQYIGRAPLVLDNLAIRQDRQRGHSMRRIPKDLAFRRPLSNAFFGRQRDSAYSPCAKGVGNSVFQTPQDTRPDLRDPAVSKDVG